MANSTSDKILFGSPELTEYYYKSRNLIFTRQLHKVYTLEVKDNHASITFFNCFRYQRNLKTGKIHAYYFNFIRNKWCADRIVYQHRYQVCPNISCLRINDGLLHSMLAGMLRQVKKYVDCDKQYQRYDRCTSSTGRFSLSGVDTVLEKSLRQKNKAFQYLSNCRKQIVKWLWQYFLISHLSH